MFRKYIFIVYYRVNALPPLPWYDVMMRKASAAAKIGFATVLWSALRNTLWKSMIRGLISTADTAAMLTAWPRLTMRWKIYINPQLKLINCKIVIGSFIWLLAPIHELHKHNATDHGKCLRMLLQPQVQSSRQKTHAIRRPAAESVDVVHVVEVAAHRNHQIFRYCVQYK